MNCYRSFKIVVLFSMLTNCASRNSMQDQIQLNKYCCRIPREWDYEATCSQEFEKILPLTWSKEKQDKCQIIFNRCCERDRYNSLCDIGIATALNDKGSSQEWETFTSLVANVTLATHLLSCFIDCKKSINSQTENCDIEVTDIHNTYAHHTCCERLKGVDNWKPCSGKFEGFIESSIDSNYFSCQDIDECSTINELCLPTETCYNIPNSYKCSDTSLSSDFIKDENYTGLYYNEDYLNNCELYYDSKACTKSIVSPFYKFLTYEWIFICYIFYELNYL